MTPTESKAPYDATLRAASGVTQFKSLKSLQKFFIWLCWRQILKQWNLKSWSWNLNKTVVRIRSSLFKMCWILPDSNPEIRSCIPRVTRLAILRPNLRKFHTVFQVGWPYNFWVGCLAFFGRFLKVVWPKKFSVGRFWQYVYTLRLNCVHISTVNYQQPGTRHGEVPPQGESKSVPLQSMA